MRLALAVAALAVATLVPSHSRAASVAWDTGPPAPQADLASPELIERLEAKWSAVMTRMRGWNAEAFRQFREGYAGYPAGVLRSALAAPSFEEMQDVLDAHAAVRAREAMAKAMRKTHPVGLSLPEDTASEQVMEAKKLAAKALGDDARDLLFIPITPCTVWDTRFASNPDSMGIIGNGQTKRFFSHLDGAGGSYAAYGGNPSCPETAQNFIGPRPFAVMMTVYVNDASANGWLTFYRDGDPDPSQATISVYYSPGPTRTQTVISKSSRGYGAGIYDIAATSRFASAHASASITGYFVKLASHPSKGVMSGRVVNPGAQAGCLTGAPTGLSLAGACSPVGAGSVAGRLPTTSVFRNLQARIDSPAVSNVSVLLIDTSGIVLYLGCTIPTGEVSCTAAGPSSPAAAGESIVTYISIVSGAVPSLAFGYEIASP